MMIASYDVEVLQHVVTVFQKNMEQPYNSWSKAAYSQGFTWREGSVGFSVFEEADPATLKAEFYLEKEAPPLGDAIRAIRVPFHVGDAGVLDVSGIYEAEDRAIKVPPGEYCLTFALSHVSGRPAADENVRLKGRFTFVKGTCKPRILRADPELNPPPKLVLDGKPA